MGKGGKTVSVATAIFNAARHAVGEFKGIYDTFSSIYHNVKKVVDWINAKYKAIRDWIDQHLGPVKAAAEKITRLYREKIKPWLEKVDARLSSLLVTVEALRGNVKYLLRRVDHDLFYILDDLQKRTDRILADLQGVVTAFDHNLALAIQNLRDELYHALRGWRDEIISRVLEKIDEVSNTIWDHLEALRSALHQRIQTVKEALDHATDLISGVIDPEKYITPTSWSASQIASADIHTSRFLAEVVSTRYMVEEATKVIPDRANITEAFLGITWLAFRTLSPHIPEVFARNERRMRYFVRYRQFKRLEESHKAAVRMIQMLEEQISQIAAEGGP